MCNNSVTPQRYSSQGHVCKLSFDCATINLRTCSTFINLLPETKQLISVNLSLCGTVGLGNIGDDAPLSPSVSGKNMFYYCHYL